MPVPEPERPDFATSPVRDLRPDQDIVRQGDRPSQCCLILEGFATAYKISGSGKRQTLAFHVAGDIPDLQSLHIEVMDMNLGTLTACKVALIQHPHMRELCLAHPRLGDVFWRETLIQASILREWLLVMGHLSATQHMAHLFCEFLIRLRAQGLVGDDNSFAFPITQGDVGDALGISSVHVNRVMQDLRAKGLVAWERAHFTVLDPEGLAALGEFEPTYLHQKPREAA